MVKIIWKCRSIRLEKVIAFKLASKSISRNCCCCFNSCLVDILHKILPLIRVFLRCLKLKIVSQNQRKLLSGPENQRTRVHTAPYWVPNIFLKKNCPYLNSVLNIKKLHFLWNGDVPNLQSSLVGMVSVRSSRLLFGLQCRQQKLVKRLGGGTKKLNIA